MDESCVDIDDLNIKSDPIKNFLNFKLDELEYKNNQLKEQLERRKTIIEQLNSNRNKNKISTLILKNLWFKVFNEKFLIGFNLHNESSLPINEINLILMWNTQRSPLYTFQVYIPFKPENCKKKTLKSIKRKREFLEEEWIQSMEVKTDCILILSITKPEFRTELSYQATGIIKYKQNSNEQELLLDKFSVSIRDFLNFENEIKIFEVINGDLNSYLSLLTATNEVKLVAFTSSNTDFEWSLEIECAFCKINSFSNSSLYCVNNSGDACNGTVLSVSKEKNCYTVQIYYKNETHLWNILHFLYSKIIGLTILPYSYKDKVNIPTDSPCGSPVLTCSERFIKRYSNDETKEFGKNLMECVGLSKEFYLSFVKRESEEFSDKYIEFRNRLADLEKECDSLKEKL